MSEVELTPEAFAALMQTPFGKRLEFYARTLILMRECFGDRQMTEAEHAAFRHHLDEVRKWWESAAEESD